MPRVRERMREAGAAALIGLMLPLAACGSPETQVEQVLAQLERQEPVFGLLREHDPSAYQDMRALIERTVRQGGPADQQQMIQRSREIFTRAIERRVMSAPDETVRDMIAFVADQTTHLESNPAVCADLLRGTAGDVRAHIPAEMQQRERQLYSNLLRSPTNSRQAVASEADAGEAIGLILAEAEGALRMDATEVSSALEGTAAPLEVCRANAYLMRRISQLPANEAAPIFRYLSQMAAQARPPSPVG